MKRILFLLILLSLSGTGNQKSVAAPNSDPPDIGMQGEFFYSSLTPHGDWIEVEPGFRVWQPLHVPRDWRPYLLGRWIWTDYGWYWISNEPFGWITYHYGRWYYDDFYGWVWVPDDVWGPAWVEWRYDDSFIGWAPLPPYATFNINVGIRFTTHWEAPVHYWNFIPYHRFGSDIRYRDTAPEQYTRRLIGATRAGSHYELDHNRIINRGVDRTIIERHGNLRIERTDVRDGRNQSGEQIIRSGDNRRIDHIEIYRPSRDDMRGTDRIEARRGNRPLSIDMSKIERPRAESRLPSDEHPQRDPARTKDPTRNPEVQRGTRQQEQSREYTPRVQEKKAQRDRQTMRRELIQRYGSKQNPSPPVNRNIPQPRTERQREIIPDTHSSRPSSERRER